jgi:HEAT repeat protein
MTVQAFLLIVLLAQADTADELTRLLERAGPANAKAERILALEELTEKGKKNPQRTCAALAPYAKDEDAEIRLKVLIAIGISAAEQRECPIPIAQALADEDDAVRGNAAAMLGFYTRYPEEAVPLLLKAVASDDRFVRQSLPDALASACGKTPRGLNAIRRLFTDVDPSVRHNAQLAHFKLTGEPHDYVGHLLRVTASPDDDSPPETDEQRTTRELLQIAGAGLLYELTRKRPDDLAKELVTYLADEKPRIRQCALRQLRAMCVTSKSSFRAVEKLKLDKKLNEMAKGDGDEDTRKWATLAQNALSEGPPETAPEVPKPLD